MANVDSTSVLGKNVIINSGMIRDSDFGEALAEDVVYVGDSLAVGSADTQVVAQNKDGEDNFIGIAIAEVIRPSDTATVSTVITDGKKMRYLKKSKGRYLVRAMAQGYDSGATHPKGAPVYYNATGSTTTSSATTCIGDFFLDPAISTLETVVGRLNKSVISPDSTTDTFNIEIEMWY